jgi:hypothetical protein
MAPEGPNMGQFVILQGLTVLAAIMGTHPPKESLES